MKKILFLLISISVLLCINAYASEGELPDGQNEIVWNIAGNSSGDVEVWKDDPIPFSVCIPQAQSLVVEIVSQWSPDLIWSSHDEGI